MKKELQSNKKEDAHPQKTQNQIKTKHSPQP